MRFAVGVPNVRVFGDPRLLLELGSRTEQAGWDGFFVWEHLVYREPGAPVCDPWTAVAAVAAATSRVRLGVMVCALPRRRPWIVARQAAAIDVLSQGRLVFGAGLGSLPDLEYAAFGEEADDRARADRLDEGLAWLLKARNTSDEPFGVRGTAGIYGAFGQMDRSLTLMREVPRDHPFWPIREAQARRNEGKPADALALLEETMRNAEYVPPPMPFIAGNLAQLEGKFADSRRYYERSCPPLKKPSPGFDDFGFCSGVPYAYALQRLGEGERAEQVLTAYLDYIENRTRLGIKGYGIGDAEALALLGERDDALVRLRQAIDAGWRTPWPRYGWHLVDDPYLAGLRNDPRFRAVTIVILSMRDREEDIVRGLEQGADDYVVKPFNARELVARVRKLLEPRDA